MNYYQYPPCMAMYGGMQYPNADMAYQQGDGPGEQSYIENILRLKLGKNCSVYLNFENSTWGSNIFKVTF